MRTTVRTIVLAAALSVALLLTACPRRQEIHLFNNTQQDLLVRYMDGKESTWSAGTLLKVTDVESARLARATRSDGASYPVVEVTSGTRRLRYHMYRDGTLPEVNLIIGSVVIAPLQLEPDGALYAVIPTGAWPAKLADPQPAGFPVKPQTSP